MVFMDGLLVMTGIVALVFMMFFCTVPIQYVTSGISHRRQHTLKIADLLMVDTSWRSQNPQTSYWASVMPHSLYPLLLMQDVLDVTVPTGYLMYWQAPQQLLKLKEAVAGVPKAGHHLEGHLGPPVGPVGFSS